MTKPLGFDLLVQQTLSAVEPLISWEAQLNELDEGPESPIERLFLLATKLAFKYGDMRGLLGLFVVSGRETADHLLTNEKYVELVLCEKQVEVKDVGRVDFVFSNINYDHNDFHTSWPDKIWPEHWKKLIVECDGHDFHERTKEQAMRDRSRDRAAVMAGYEVFRFTGAEIWRDPLGCGSQVMKWAMKGY